MLKYRRLKKWKRFFLCCFFSFICCSCSKADDTVDKYEFYYNKICEDYKLVEKRAIDNNGNLCESILDSYDDITLSFSRDNVLQIDYVYAGEEKCGTMNYSIGVHSKRKTYKDDILYVSLKVNDTNFSLKPLTSWGIYIEGYLSFSVNDERGYHMFSDFKRYSCRLKIW